MDRLDRQAQGEYGVTVFHCSDLAEIEIKILIRRFRRALEKRLGIPRRILAIQYDY